MSINYNFKDKVVIVTGGSGGLGAAVVSLFVEAGAKTIAPDRVIPEGSTANPGCDYLLLDALNEKSVADVLNEIKSRYGRIDALVNVIGGYAAGQTVAELDLAVLERQLDLNLKSAFLLTKYAVQEMAETGGKIVHISSRAAIDKGEKSFAYSVSKLGVLRLIEATAAEAKNLNININAVLPSIMDTPTNRQSMPDADFSKWPKTEQVAKVIAFLCSEEAELINGAAIPVYGKF